MTTKPRPPARKGPAIDWLTNATVLAHAVRGLANSRRTVVLQLACGGRTGEIAFERGNVIAARSRRLTGQDAFNHLMMWADVKLTLRDERLPVTMRVRTDLLLDVALNFCEQLDGGAHVLGGPRSTFAWVPSRLAALASDLPAPVRAFAAGVNDGTRLADLVEDSSFATSDALKICYRLCELGVLDVTAPTSAAPSVPSQLAIVDWLLTANASTAAKATPKATPLTPAPPKAEPAPPMAKPAPPMAEPADDTSPQVASEAVPAVPEKVPARAMPPLPPVEAPKRPPRREPAIESARPPRGDKTSKTSRSSRLSKPFAKSDLSFDDLDRAFFAQEVELQRIEQTDRFEDLEDTASRYKLKR